MGFVLLRPTEKVNSFDEIPIKATELKIQKKT